jgi:uncharacterized membrane protein
MTESNPNARLEAFCDGVFAIALTLLIIDVRIPAAETITSTAQLWRAVAHVGPSIVAFLLSFTVILITWVNHHATLALIDKSSSPFIYANGLLLLTVVLMPFPTALVGDYLFTDHAGPAVVLYEGVGALQAIGWIFIGGTALHGHLARSTHSAAVLRESRRYGYFACALYALFGVAALWFPVAVAVLTSITWVFWLILSIRTRSA